jgi:hypothetical protein
MIALTTYLAALLILIEAIVGLFIKYYRDHTNLLLEDKLEKNARDNVTDSLTLSGFIIASISISLAISRPEEIVAQSYFQALLVSMSLFFLAYSLSAYTMVYRYFKYLQDRCLSVGFLTLLGGLVLFIGGLNGILAFILFVPLVIVGIIHLAEFIDKINIGIKMGKIKSLPKYKFKKKS